MKDATHRYGRVVVFGGGSEIAHATLLELAREGGYTAVLAARHPEELDVGELERAGITVERVPFDALQLGSHADAVAEAFGSRDVDLVVVAFGVLGEQAHDERDAEAAVAVAATNYVGAVSVLTIVAERLREQGHGAIVVLSSVAAQRARRSNYVYGSSKAGLDAFADGLALTLDDTGVRLVIVRPGFVRTKMTAGLRPMPLSVGATEVGAAIAGALRSERSVIWVPALLRVVMALIRLAPRAVVQRL
jgi:decaprenylphospho-beta-D-erythro-pentofuranosid-2-ulose 2-reductase